MKAVTKRDLTNATKSNAYASALVDTTEKPTETPSLSENVNLFQSLRVLQEGETDDNTKVFSNARKFETTAQNQTCLKTSTFSALGIGLSLTICMLSCVLMIACSRLKQRSKASLYDSYITHKGQIDQFVQFSITLKMCI